MPDALIVMIGGPAGAVGVVGEDVTGGVGAVGVDAVVPPEQATVNKTVRSKTMRSTVCLQTGGATGISVAILADCNGDRYRTRGFVAIF
jgi:hypothetical protein